MKSIFNTSILLEIEPISTDYYRQAIWNSIKVTIVSTILASVIGVSLAYITTNIKIFGSRVINVLIVVSMFSPPFIGAYSWILMFGRAGSVTKFFASHGIKLPSIYGFTGIMIVFTLHLFIYIYMYTKGALKKVDATLIEATESLGDHGLKKVLKVSLPLVTPTILAGGAIVFLRAFADYGTPRLIGEGFTTMPVLVYNEKIDPDRGGREIRRQGERRPEEGSRLYRDDLRVYLRREGRDGRERCASKIGRASCRERV